MAPNALLIEVHPLAGRYHGTSDWPPSPFRLFQALVAGAYGGRWTSEPRAEKNAAFKWLEGLQAPCTVTPPKREGCRTTYYVPNNDLDAKGGDPRRAADIRAAKELRPLLLGSDESFLYVWRFTDGIEHANKLCALAERLHTLGRGIDPAFAKAEVLTWSDAEQRVRLHPGVISAPARSGGHMDNGLTCPIPGSFDSLEARHIALGCRFDTSGRSTFFRHAPKAESRTISYARRTSRFLLELRTLSGAFRPASQANVIELTAMVRRHLLTRLSKAMPSRENEIRRAIESGPGSLVEQSCRVRVIPLPTIGHPHASGSIRRVVVEVPPDCPIRPDDVAWAVAGQELESLTTVDDDTGEVLTTVLVPSDEDKLLRHYGIGCPSRRYRTVTPVALALESPKGQLAGTQRRHWAELAARKLVDVVRNSGLPTGGLIVHTQREPFHAKGLRADQFHGARSIARTVVHAELIFAEPVTGPIILGEGAYDGLGLFRPADAPVQRSSHAIGPAARASDNVAVHEGPLLRPAGAAEAARFVIRHGPPVALTLRVAEAVRAALMSHLGAECPPEISGRNEVGPLHSTAEHTHAFYLPEDADGDGFIDHILVYCPVGFSKMSRRAMDALSRLWMRPNPERDEAGGEWQIALEIFGHPDNLRTSRLIGRSRRWTSVTPYLKPRFDRKVASNAEAGIASYRDQVLRERRIRFPGAPLPTVDALHELDGSTSPGLAADAHAFVRSRGGRGGHQPDLRGTFLVLNFPAAVCGPVALGKHAHFGMGLFART